MFGLPRFAQLTFQITNDAEVVVRYRLGDRTFDLAPRVTRTHERWRAIQLTVDWPGEHPATTVNPQGGERYIAVQGASGQWRPERMTRRQAGRQSISGARSAAWGRFESGVPRV